MRLLSKTLVAVVTSAVLSGAATAQEKETRTYTVTVDGKESGKGTVAAVTHADGTLDLTSSLDVTVKVLGISNSVAYRGAERWKDGKLVGLDAASDDNGTKTRVKAVRDGDRLVVEAGGAKAAAGGGAVPNTYWLLPATAAATGKATVLETDSGKEVAATVQTVGNKMLAVGAQQTACTHYRLTAGKQTYDLYYDAQGRLVRQEFEQQGFRTVIALGGVGK